MTQRLVRMQRYAEFTGAVNEGKMAGSFATVVREAKKRNDRVQELVAQLKEATMEADAYDAEVRTRMEEMQSKAEKVGKLLVTLVEKAGRVSYSYKDAEGILYGALLKINEAAAKAAAAAVDALKKTNPGKVEVKYALSESLATDAMRWIRSWWNKLVAAFSDYDEAAAELERAVGAA